MSYHQNPPESGRRQGPPYPLLGGNGGATGRAPATGVYGMQFAQATESYGGPPPSPVVNSWERGYVSPLDDSYIRQDPGILPGAGTPLGSGTSGNGEASFLVSGGASTMGAPLQSYYPPSLYGVPTSVYPFQPGFHGHYGGGAGGGSGAAGSTGAGASASSGGNFYGQGIQARSTNPGQPIQTTTNLQGPDGCNLFVFHIPNTMTNEALFRLFSKFGNVISARIMVEKATGRSRGFGFVSYDNRESAEKAISQMNGYQIEHKRLKVQHKKDKERDRYVPAPSPTQAARMIGAGPGTAGASRVPPSAQHHYRQPMLPPHASAMRHHPGANDLMPPSPGVAPTKVGDDTVTDGVTPPSPATEGAGGGSVGAVVQGFTGGSAEEETSGMTGEVEVSGDPTFGRSGEKFSRTNDHPHLAYIYRGRGAAPREEEGAGSYGDGKAPVGEDEGPDGPDPSVYRTHEDNSYLSAPSASVGGTGRPRAVSPDPKNAAARPRSASPGAVVGTGAMPHQSLEHAMQTQLSLGGSPSAPNQSSRR